MHWVIYRTLLFSPCTLYLLTCSVILSLIISSWICVSAALFTFSLLHSHSVLLWQLPPHFPFPFIIQGAVAWMSTDLDPNFILRYLMRHLMRRLVTLVAVSIMSCCNNTSHTAGSDTCWCSWQDECIFVKWMCQLIVGISSDTGRSVVVAFGLVMNMYWQQASSRGSVWSGIYMDIYSVWGRLAGRQAGGKGVVEQGELSSDMCVNVTAG